MTKAAPVAELQALHRLVARSLTSRIQQDMEDQLPTDAATIGAAIKFLKDNNVSADPADAADLGGLREALAEARAKRAQNRSNVVSLAGADLKQATGG